MTRGDPYKPTPEVPHTQRSDAKTDARIAQSRELQRRVVQMRPRPMTFQAIGDELGISKAQAHKLWKAATEQEPIEGVDEARYLEGAKLDARERRANRIIIAHEREILAEGTPLARREKCARVISSQQLELDRIAGHRAKLNGLLAPTKHQVMGADDGPVQVQTVTREEVLAKIARIAGEPAPGPVPVTPDGEANGVTEAPVPAVDDPPASASVPPAAETDADDLDDLSGAHLDEDDDG